MRFARISTAFWADFSAFQTANEKSFFACAVLPVFVGGDRVMPRLLRQPFRPSKMSERKCGALKTHEGTRVQKQFFILTAFGYDFHKLIQRFIVGVVGSVLDVKRAEG